MRLALPPNSCKIYTPSPLADAMVMALGDAPDYYWLEPSHGKGAFVEALARRSIERDRIVAIDLDPTPAAADKLARTYRGIDFLRWSSQTNRRFDRIVGNPPYVAISQLPASLRATAAEVTDLGNRRIGNGANVWYAFVLTSLKLLNPGGSLAFVLPSSAEYADYSAAIRTAVRNQFERLELYRSSRPLFSDVQEGTLVAIARNFQAQPFRVVRRRFGNQAELIAGLSSSSKINGRRCPERVDEGIDGTIRFSSVADLRLGGVTGDARYFLMSEQRRRELTLPIKAFTPVVSRARHLRSLFIDRVEWTKLKQSGKRVWLFNPSGHILDHPSVKKYLRRRAGGCNRAGFKVSNRTPWYRTPLPPTPHAFLSGMCQSGPWLCMNEMPCLNASNTLYVAIFKDANVNERYGYAISFLTSPVRRQLKRAGRRYADGLIKYEPSALGALRLPVLSANADYRSIYARALKMLLEGRVKDATAIADSALSAEPVDHAPACTDRSTVLCNSTHIQRMHH